MEMPEKKQLTHYRNPKAQDRAWCAKDQPGEFVEKDEEATCPSCRTMKEIFSGDGVKWHTGGKD